MPGPRNVLRPELPKAPFAGIAKAAGLNHWATDGLGTDGSPTRLGYHLPPRAPLLLFVPTVIVKGRPVSRTNRVDACQPPKMASRIPPRFMYVRPLPNGS